MWAGALCGGDGAELGGEGGKEVGLVLSDECGIRSGVSPSSRPSIPV